MIRRPSVFLDPAIVAASIALVLLFPFWLNRYFYFADDYQTAFMPMFHEIARQLESGTFPLLTDRAWRGGAIVTEYQYAVFNPICLLLYLVLDLIPDVAWAGAVYAIVHYAIFAAGTYLLCIAFGCTRRAAAIGAVTACSSTWLLYWGAQTWIAALVSISWVPWCLVALHLVYQDRRWLPVGSIATALPLLSGWPFTDVSLALLLAIIVVAAISCQVPISRLAWVVISAGLGTAFALPALLPTAVYLLHSARSVAGVDRFAWRAGLDGLMTLGLPTYLGPWRGFEGPLHFYTPSFFYLAWFAPIVIVNEANRPNAIRQKKCLMLCAGVFALLSTAPALSQLRWSFRFIPYFHFVVALLVADILSADERAGRSQTWRLLPTVFAIAVPLAIAVLTFPKVLLASLMSAGAAAFFSWRVASAQSRGDAADVYAWLLISQATFVILIVINCPVNTAIPQWRPPTNRAAAPSAPTQISLFAPPGFRHFTGDFWREFSVGNRGLLYGRATINGYTPIGLPGLDKALCFDWISASCPQIGERLFARDGKTGLPLIDLLRISRVVAQGGRYSETFRQEANRQEWPLVAETESAKVFARRQPLADSAIAWASPGVGAAEQRSGALKIAIAPGSTAGDVILARPWLPGYTAELNGKQLRVAAYRDMLIDIKIPAGVRGTIVVQYWPAGLTAGFIGAGLAAAALLALSLPVLAARKRRLDA